MKLSILDYYLDICYLSNLLISPEVYQEFQIYDTIYFKKCLDQPYQKPSIDPKTNGIYINFDQYCL